MYVISFLSKKQEQQKYFILFLVTRRKAGKLELCLSSLEMNLWSSNKSDFLVRGKDFV